MLSKLPFNYSHDIMHYYANGLFDHEKVLSGLRIKDKELSFATNIPINSIHSTGSDISNEVRVRIEEWASAINKVAEFFNDETKTMRWFNSENPQLANLTPRDMIISGRFKKLLQFINASLGK